jgi:hypothetical protein
MDIAITRYIEVARHASLEELAEVSDAIDRLHHAYSDEIAEKHLQDAEALRTRHPRMRG